MERVNGFLMWWLKTVQKVEAGSDATLHATGAFEACIDTNGNKQNKKERFVPHQPSIPLAEICLILPLKIEKFMHG